MTYFVSDDLKLLRTYFSDLNTKNGSAEIPFKTVNALARRLNMMVEQCLEFENKLSRLEWNELARLGNNNAGEQLAIDALINEASKPNSNLVLADFGQANGLGGAS